MKLNLRKLEQTEELKMGDTILTVDHYGAESLERIDCIDNGEIFTFGLADNSYSLGEDLSTYLEDYSAVYAFALPSQQVVSAKNKGEKK